MIRKWTPTLAVAAMASLICLGSATADERSPTKTVKAWDLDLAKPADVETLYERVRAAAAELCGREAHAHWKQTRQPAPLGWREHCVTEAVDAVVRDVGNPRLAALHH
jgi:UrcA family protein